MGMGVKMICSNCHEEEQLFFGCGYLGFNKDVYVCKRCGFWKQTESASSAFDAPKDIFDDNSENDIISEKEVKKEICPSCKILMKKYEKYYNGNDEPIISKMTCSKCGGILKAVHTFCWD
ncbi:MAG: hypothetical protein J6T84_10430 [Spirochaetaceae bacterium]|nr:hypothetical protein [Spirochaetaceae bacterium]